MTESTAEGRSSTTTTTVLDGKNGSVHKMPLKMTKSVSQDLKTTFSSPAAWLLVVALIVTWSAVAIVIFDLVDYKSFSGGPISKLRNDPVRIIHDAVDDTTDWIYAIFSTVSDLVSFDDERKGVIQPIHRKVVHIDREEIHEKLQVKAVQRILQKEKDIKEEKLEKAKHKVMYVL
ncbi:triadin-like isoform 1-T2 [Mantella aurantiaca]